MTDRGMGETVGFDEAAGVVVAAPAYRGFGLNVPTRALVTIGCGARSGGAGVADGEARSGVGDVVGIPGWWEARDPRSAAGGIDGAVIEDEVEPGDAGVGVEPWLFGPREAGRWRGGACGVGQESSLDRRSDRQGS